MNYFKLYFTCIKRAMISRLQYKTDTLIGILSFLVTNAASILTLYFIISSIPSFEGWDMYQLGFLYGFSMLPVALDHLLTDELWVTAYWKVAAGKLDQFFIRPVSVLFQILAENFQPEAFGELIVGVVMIIFCSIGGGISWGVSTVLLAIVATVFGAAIIAAVKIIFTSFALKFKRSGPLLQIVYNFIRYTNYPVAIYPAAIRALLTFVLPFAVIISYPVESIIFGGINPYLLMGIIIAAALILFTLAVVIWNAFEKHYQSSGS